VVTRCIVGAGAQGRVTLEIWRAQHEHDRFVFLDQDPALHGGSVLGAAIVGAPDESASLGGEVIVAIGDNWRRLEVAGALGPSGARFGRAIHPRAVISPSSSIAEGAVVHPGAIVHTEATVGRHVIVNTGAIVEHDCRLDDGSSIGPGAQLGGRVQIGPEVFLGTGVTVAPRVQIGQRAIVGAGAVVVDDLPGHVLAYGVPARVVREIDDAFDFRRAL
jgi:acetyltransferase EpsM